MLLDWELVQVAPHSHDAHVVEVKYLQVMHRMLYFGFADGLGYVGRVCDMMAQSSGACNWNMWSSWH